jgi:Trypsin-like peptidase domain
MDEFSSFARIFSSTDKASNIAVGVGFCVAPGYVMTCAHVVNEALGLDERSQFQPEGLVVFDFPFSGDTRRFEGWVKEWRAVNQAKSHSDIALLEVGGALPNTVRSIELDTRTDLPLTCKGFPEGYNLFPLSTHEMTVMNISSNGYVQLSNPGGLVAPGFSGGPVWEKGRNAIVGMIVEADVGREIAFMIPAEELASFLGRTLRRYHDGRSSLTDFVGVLNWIGERSGFAGLRGLSQSDQKKLVNAINRAKRESTWDFYPVELRVLELSAHYVFYYLKDRRSPIVGKKSKGEYLSELKEFSAAGQTIRTGKERLSMLVKASEMRHSVTEEFSKTVEKLEV